jgi:hypothetical protein
MGADEIVQRQARGSGRRRHRRTLHGFGPRSARMDGDRPRAQRLAARDRRGDRRVGKRRACPARDRGARGRGGGRRPGGPLAAARPPQSPAPGQLDAAGHQRVVCRPAHHPPPGGGTSRAGARRRDRHQLDRRGSHGGRRASAERRSAPSGGPGGRSGRGELEGARVTGSDPEPHRSPGWLWPAPDSAAAGRPGARDGGALGRIAPDRHLPVRRPTSSAASRGTTAALGPRASRSSASTSIGSRTAVAGPRSAMRLPASGRPAGWRS